MESQMPDDSQDESSQLDPSVLTLTQEADRIYNVVRGDINNYISIFRRRPATGLLGQLDRMRTNLNDKKRELYDATRRRGANSKDARAIAEDAAIYRNQVYALKELIAASDELSPIPSFGNDVETLQEAVLRFKQIEDNARRLEQEAARTQEEREKNHLYYTIAAVALGMIVLPFAFPILVLVLLSFSAFLIPAAIVYGIYWFFKNG